MFRFFPPPPVNDIYDLAWDRLRKTYKWQRANKLVNLPTLLLTNRISTVTYMFEPRIVQLCRDNQIKWRLLICPGTSALIIQFPILITYHMVTPAFAGTYL
jgi:hypothetical protein